MSAIVDAHVHLYAPTVAEHPAAWAEQRGERHWAALCTRRRRDGRPVQAMPTLTELLTAMDSAEVSRAVLLGWYWEQHDTAAEQNRFLADCARRHPDRLLACATFHPAAGAAVVRAELARCRDEGIVGLGELSPHSQGFRCDDPVFAQALAQAAGYGWAVNLHVTDPESRPFPGRIDTPRADFLALARAHPQVKFILAHWGGLLPLRWPEALALPNVWYDTAASPLMYGDAIWSQFLTAVPSDRVLFGSDYPLNLYPRVSVAAEMARFVAEARVAGAGASVLGENALRIFGGERK